MVVQGILDEPCAMVVVRFAGLLDRPVGHAHHDELNKLKGLKAVHEQDDLPRIRTRSPAMVGRVRSFDGVNPR